MPVYHFNVHDGLGIPDPDGTELADLRSARTEAVRLAGRLLMDQPEAVWDGSGWHLEVANDRGAILFRLDFMATEAAPAPA